MVDMTNDIIINIPKRCILFYYILVNITINVNCYYFNFLITFHGFFLILNQLSIFFSEHMINFI
jgi:hypothetical protein